MSQSDSPGSHPQNTAPESRPGLDLNLVEFPSASVETTAPERAESAPSISADLLNDIVERARIAANASDAAIALRQGEDIVCLATTGPNAPDIGVRLNLNSGLSGACAQSKSFQRCDDSENDARVDPELCRRLGIRSVLVFPILRGDALLGIVEVFSPNARAFGDREVQALASLSRTIGYILERPPEAAAGPVSDEAAPVGVPETPASAASEPAQVEEAQASVPSEAAAGLPPAPRQDHWMTVLTVAVIVVAIALGWLLGHGGLRRSSPVAQNSAPPKSALPVQQPSAVLPSTLTETSPAATKEKAASPSAPKREAIASQSARSGELVILQNGKVIYRQGGSQPSTGATQPPPAFSPSTAAQPGVANAVLVSPETANQYLAQRVEPEYPEPAREQHIQGPVTLEAIVGKDGSVKALKTISGDPQLAAAARYAVSQWRFKPYLRDGKPAEFQTNVTVNFRLP